MTAASPGVISLFLENRHYPSHEAYIAALAEAMKEEYDAIHQAGFVLQLDCPDLAVGRHVQGADESLSDWKQKIGLHIEAINAATREIPPEDLRLHLCWGNYEGPHNHDVPLAEIIGIVLKARPSAISFEAANPRHEHEWRVFEDIELPDDKVLLPGVIDSTTNYVEHPELVAQRIINYANAVGRERVIASSDCGFGTFAGLNTVASDVTFAKLAAMAEGAELASGELWHGRPAHRKLAPA
jgi:5-methyltetrahydropteroyltriglutamate--homocysteine methyltransferase